MMTKLRRKLTAFNTLITGGILLAMTLLCIGVSEGSTRSRAFQTFSEDLSTTAAYLESQTQLSNTWLQKMERGGKYVIAIRDGDRPLYSTSLTSQRRELTGQFRKAEERAVREQGLDSRGGSCVFPMTGENGEHYYAGCVVVPKGEARLEITILHPLTPMESSIRSQRMVVALGVFLAWGLIWAFSWFFTGKLLKPIEENQRRQTEFTAAASHELRTPLAAILSAASVMEQVPRSEQAHFGAIIRREGDRMTRLLGDMLTLAGADSQTWELHPESVEPDMLALAAYEACLPQAREKGLTLKLSLPEDCPAGYYDKDRIGQVLSILLNNAMSYTPSPGSLGLTLEVGKDAIRYRVWDTGPGVPDGEKQRIFQRFYRGEGARPGNSHFGLGLCIGAEIARLHKGRLWVEDNPGGGAVFVLELPLS